MECGGLDICAIYALSIFPSACCSVRTPMGKDGDMLRATVPLCMQCRRPAWRGRAKIGVPVCPIQQFGFLFCHFQYFPTPLTLRLALPFGNKMADIPMPFLGVVLLQIIFLYIHQSTQDEPDHSWGAFCLYPFHCLPCFCCTDHVQYDFHNFLTFHNFHNHLPKYGTVLRSCSSNRTIFWPFRQGRWVCVQD